jgi:hypothetical protein
MHEKKGIRRLVVEEKREERAAIREARKGKGS